jgi:hypothetical protein
VANDPIHLLVRPQHASARIIRKRDATVPPRDRFDIGDGERAPVENNRFIHARECLP